MPLRDVGMCGGPEGGGRKQEDEEVCLPDHRAKAEYDSIENKSVYLVIA